MATILIVDDEQPLRELLAEVLESDGHRVLVGALGEPAELVRVIVTPVMRPVSSVWKTPRYWPWRSTST